MLKLRCVGVFRIPKVYCFTNNFFNLEFSGANFVRVKGICIRIGGLIRLDMNPKLSISLVEYGEKYRVFYV